MKLSVILPCFNGAETIAVQLQALVGQHWPGGWELIVVNNGSTDRSMEIVDAYRDRFRNLTVAQAHVPNTPRLGVPHSYNTGIKAATGDAYVFCEADDEVAPGWLAAMGHALTQHDFVVARLDHRKLNAEWLHPVQGNGMQSEGLHRIDHLPCLFVAAACGFGLRRALYERVGPLSTAFPIAHDAEYSCRAQLAGYTLYFEPEALVYYREKTEFKAMFRQGQNWGLDTTRVQYYYGFRLARFAMLRQLVRIGLTLPSGIVAWLTWALQLPNGRSKLKHWIWSMGWYIGRLLSILQYANVRKHKAEISRHWPVA